MSLRYDSGNIVNHVTALKTTLTVMREDFAQAVLNRLLTQYLSGYAFYAIVEGQTAVEIRACFGQATVNIIGKSLHLSGEVLTDTLDRTLTQLYKRGFVVLAATPQFTCQNTYYHDCIYRTTDGALLIGVAIYDTGVVNQNKRYFLEATVTLP